MAHFNGKWRLVSAENTEEYANAVHASEEKKNLLRLAGAECKANPDFYIEEFKVDVAAHTCQRIVYIKGEKKRDSGVIKFGVEVDQPCHERPAKVRVELEGEHKIVRHVKGADFTAVKIAEVHGDEIISKMTAGGVTATQKFKRV